MDVLDGSVPNFLFLMHVLQALVNLSLLSFLSYYCCLDLPCFLCFLLQHGSLLLFISSSYRSELFFHPVLLHETRASLKASLLFSVCRL